MNMPDTVTVAVCQEGIQGELSYFMIKDVVMIEEACVPVYGVAVAFSSEAGTELCRIHNVTENRDRMAHLIHRMAGGQVFPISLRDIIEDFIA